MAPISMTAGALLGLACLGSSKPLHRRQEETATTAAEASEASTTATTNSDDPLSGLNTDVDFWCTGKDTLDAEVMQDLWERDIPGFNIGGSEGDWLSRQAESFTEGDPNDKWADNIMLAADPKIGVSGLGGCGVIGSQCQPNIDCEDWVSRGFGTHYWAIQSLVGFHDKLNVAHEYLQDETLENFMSLTDIANDFTKPAAWTNEDDMAAILGAIFYLMGGIAGFGGLFANRAGSAMARAGVAKASKARVQPSIDKLADGPTKEALQKRLDDSIRTADAMLGAEGGAQASKATAALGSSTYLVGGIFGAVGIGSEAAFGEVTAGDLEPMLKGIFSNARTYLEQMGRLATGRRDASKGDEYSFLPGQHPIDGDYPVDNDIAKFFHDGNMLLGPAHPAFNETLEAAFSTMRPRIVDQALVTGKFFAFADEQMESAEDCKDFAETGDDDNYPWFGSQWIADKYCMRLMRDAGAEQLCANEVDRCTFFPATQEDYDKLQSKYGFNMVEYFEHALDCTLNGGEDRKPDVWALPEDGSTPRCWFGLEARKGIEDCGIYDGSPQSCSIDFHDF